MFPLGTALLPGEPLPLRIFEPRYRAMLGDCLDGPYADARFGVVLIARGSEVGGGDVRHDVGTFAAIDAVDRLPDGRATVVCSGTARFRVVEWLPDDPYPRARVQTLADLEFTDAAHTRLRDQGARIRELVGDFARARDVDPAQLQAIFDDSSVDADPVRTLYRWVASLPAGPLDRQRLLEAADADAALDALTEAAEGFAARMQFGA